ncbi:zf-HC2 domain-containing protein [Streptomyces sp. RB6PN25]|uniref:Zf-HC2 domain-containing protein n=1 Tax=Streptomyces humicola TaxID=2953240 RepID=A0ABT1PSW4_9ACTN|nr:zf-HC2 domain-containing protein [Streptomyces humicola]MCQ4080213.1 zf-HC2 domain-containing protein [Streptomyces humicola]
MSGTGPFRHPRISARTPAEEHLGDRLAAFVDGELDNGTRERVAAHLATCEQCKAEADEQRRLKNVVAGAMPPALSAGLIARLQGLPGGGPDGPGDGGPFDGGLLGRDAFAPRTGLGGRGGRGGFGELGSDGEADSYLTPGRGSVLAPTGERLEGFRIHDVTRSASRGRRFAFVAAGAFSMAAIALGGALPFDAALEGGAAGDGGAAATSANITDVPHATRQQPGGQGVTPGVGATPVSDLQRLFAPQGGRAHAALPSPADGVSPADVAAATPLSARSMPPRAIPVLGPPHNAPSRAPQLP